MYNTNRIKLIIVAIVASILITIVLRYLLTILFSVFGFAFFQPISATIYVGAYLGLHFFIDKAVQQGKYPWMRSDVDA